MAIVLLTAAGSAGCDTESAGASSDGPIRLEVWAHAGQPGERRTLEEQAQRFNATQDSIRVELAFLPEGSYAAQLQASAVAGRLPDLVDVDGPYVPRFAWQGHLRPLDGLLPDSLLGGVLPSILEQGRWRDRLYAVGTFDSGLGLYGRRSALERVGFRIPAGPEDAWTAAETAEVLAALADGDADGAVLDLKLNYEGEWFTYAFQPALRSGGGGLIERASGVPVAEGTLDGPATVGVMETVQGWLASGYVDPNLDDAAFVDGRVALSWSGHWDYPRYADALGEDLVVLPLPDFGTGTRTGQGSWMWGVPTTTNHADAAAAFLGFLLRSEEVLAMARANGGVPGTRRAIRGSERYGPGGPLELFALQLERGWSVPRPRTPVYPFASSIFQDAFEALRDGTPLGPELTAAARAVDREVRDNRGYPDVAGPDR